jgi:hypothetical protein
MKNEKKCFGLLKEFLGTSGFQKTTVLISV